MKTRLKVKQIVFSITALAVCLLLVSTTSVSAKTYNLKIQSAYPHGDVSLELLKVFAESAKKRSNGNLLISVFGDGDVVPGDQMFNAVKRGTLDMLHALGAMWAY